MSKIIKRIITITLITSTFSTVLSISPIKVFDIAGKPAYAASYSPSNGELKSLKIKAIDGDTLDLRDSYYGDEVKLNDDKEYYTRLTDDSDGIKIDANVKGDDYIVRIFTSDSSDAVAYEPGDEILLGKGNTTIYVRTYESLSAFRKAKDQKKDVTDCDEEYTINVKKTTDSSYEDDTQDPIYLEDIDLSKGDISFLKQRTSYDIKVDSSVSEIKITAKPEDEDDRVRINGSLVDSDDNYKKTISLDKGDNEIKVKVTDNKDNQRTYTLNITRGNSSDTEDDIYLDDLTLSDGDIDFSEDETSYDVDVDESVSKITIGAEPEDDEYLVTIDGDEVSSDDDYEKKVSLDKGENTIKVTVQDEVNDKKRVYTLNIIRGKADEDTNTDKDNQDSNTGDQGTGKKSGWVQTNGSWEYYDENGAKLTGWLQKDDKWYLLNSNGTMLSGWQYTGGKWYMLDKASGSMKTGWYKEETTAANNNNSSDGTDKDTSNTTKVENWYYLNQDGSMKTGWFLDNGSWYFLNANGIMQKGWLIYSNSKYYLNDDGTMATGTKVIDGKTYNFTENGVLII
ncbi:cell wall binding repeat-containing protein [Clostridium sp. DL-VIII]|uniref:cadherin-like beta sandwich domain-containing protein n=1 Tax=Clostridium sp. DL-VIII TaxID=641107 RepID=UPI00023B0794|nr:cadherin-like beta sandwich domain-containing protein [Clostridium sp. DL-VIII]EHJ02152.1 cell wall binding repeat-containing protein [Clostridium sp. DL-VIII]